MIYILKLTALFFFFFLNSASADPVVGREAAAPYFSDESRPARVAGPRDHYMVLHIGKLVNSNAWNWGSSGREKDVGAATIGVTYRTGEWKGLTDTLIRLDFNEFDIKGEKPQKLSFLPMIMFPEASSEFPLYFGAGVGPGVFFNQVGGEAYLTLDYQLVVGMRFFNVFESVGFSVESGLKNHIQIGDDGQLNSAFFALGAVFTF